MNEPFEKVLHYLFGDRTLDTISIDRLQHFANDHPYFPVAHLLLAKKLKDENNTAFITQAQKTALYFSNPYWLDYQLNNYYSFELNSDKKSINGEINSEIKTEDFSEEPASNEENASQAEEEMAAITRDTTEETDKFLKEVTREDELHVRDHIEEVFRETLSPDAEAQVVEVSEEMAGVINESEPSTTTFLNEAQELEKKNEKRTYSTEQKFAEAENLKPPSFRNFLSQTKEDDSEADEHELMFRNIKAMLDATSEEANADTKDAVIPIDPYYTIDYFASQGIKLELDQNPKDELGQHLKKFTQWLKHMKKLGPEDATEVINRNNQSEADIQKIADSSNTVREVVTEAMALVLEKQGKKDKAIELYTKLSFLNSDKSTYFASKIKTLKGI